MTDQPVHEYLGDGVYVTWTGYELQVEANDHLRPTDVVCLEPRCFAALVRFAERMGLDVDVPAADAAPSPSPDTGVCTQCGPEGLCRSCQDALSDTRSIVSRIKQRQSELCQDEVQNDPYTGGFHAGLQEAIRLVTNEDPGENPRGVQDFQVLCDASVGERISVKRDGRNQVSVSVVLDRIPVGWTAAYCRELGMNVPDDIPDCAVVGPDGKTFEWVNLDFTAQEKTDADEA